MIWRKFRSDDAAAKTFSTEYYNAGIHQGALAAARVPQAARPETELKKMPHMPGEAMRG